MRMAALIVAALLGAGGCVDRSITRADDRATMSVDEVVAGLRSPDFRDVLRARRHLNELPDAMWARAMQRLADDPAPQVRLIAAVEACRRDTPEAHRVLVRLSHDSDETVRAEARASLRLL